MTMLQAGGWILDYQQLLAALLGVVLSTFALSIGWHVNRLYRKSDEHEARLASLEARVATKTDLQYLEVRFEGDLKELERRLERSASRQLEAIERLNERFDYLVTQRAQDQWIKRRVRTEESDE